MIRSNIPDYVVKTSIVQCYAPTNEAEEDEKEKFYEHLQAQKDKTPKHHLTIIMGDLNAKVGKDNKYIEQSMGKEGLRERNENGQKLVDICCDNNMVITGTIFQCKNIHNSTWTSPDNKTNNQIDHIVINNK